MVYKVIARYEDEIGCIYQTTDFWSAEYQAELAAETYSDVQIIEE
jgi:hypothetical protein